MLVGIQFLLLGLPFFLVCMVSDMVSSPPDNCISYFAGALRSFGSFVFTPYKLPNVKQLRAPRPTTRGGPSPPRK